MQQVAVNIDSCSCNQTTRNLMLIDYILESGSEILLLGVDYFPEALVAAVDTDRCFFGGG
jgi:hypothetical protein